MFSAPVVYNRKADFSDFNNSVEFLLVTIGNVIKTVESTSWCLEVEKSCFNIVAGEKIRDNWKVQESRRALRGVEGVIISSLFGRLIVKLPSSLPSLKSLSSPEQQSNELLIE